MKVLVIDDDPALLHVLKTSLEQEGHSVFSATNGNDGLSLAYERRPDVVILDVMMPQLSGWTTCRRLRDLSRVPIIFLSARAAEADIVAGLNAGADDYLVKPFSLAELKARIEAVVRRVGGDQAVIHPLVYDDGNLYINLVENTVRKGGQEIALSPKEAHLLSCLVRNAGIVMTHEQLLHEVWGAGYEKELAYLTLYIRYLRTKLEDDPSHPRYIMTRFRVGYYFCGLDRSKSGKGGGEGQASPATA